MGSTKPTTGWGKSRAVKRLRCSVKRVRCRKKRCDKRFVRVPLAAATAGKKPGQVTSLRWKKNCESPPRRRHCREKSRAVTGVRCSKKCEKNLARATPCLKSTNKTYHFLLSNHCHHCHHCHRCDRCHSDRGCVDHHRRLQRQEKAAPAYPEHRATVRTQLLLLLLLLHYRGAAERGCGLR